MNRWYDPLSGRWISRDPAGLEGGENAYEFCDGNPLTFVDPSGLQDITLQDQINSYLGRPDQHSIIAAATRFATAPLRHVGTPNASWDRSMQTLYDWLDGSLPDTIEYPFDSPETQDVIHSKIAADIWATLIKKRFLPRYGYYTGGISTWSAFVNSISQASNGTQFQLGAVDWHAWRKGNVIHIKVENDMTPSSFLLHLPFGEWCASELGPMHKVHQVFQWQWKIK